MEFNQFKKSIEKATEERDRRLESIERNKHLPIVLFGYGNKGKQIVKQLSKRGYEIFIHDLNPLALERAANNGFKTIDSVKDLADCQVVLCSGQAQIEQKNMAGDNYLFYEEATYAYDLMHVQSPAKQMSDIVLQEIEKFYWLYNIMQEESRTMLFDTLLFRASLNPSYIQKTRIENKSMWLDIPTLYKSREYDCFLDVGAFDGDTIESARKTFNINRVHAVEANTEFISKISQQARDFSHGLAIYPYAAWSSNRMLAFAEDHNGMFNVIESDNGNICAARLDSIVNEKVDLIKMDIEGSESQALEGSSHLLSSSPDLLMAVYHKPFDFVDIATSLLKQNPNYRVHFSHYSDVFDDSIMYFLA